MELHLDQELAKLKEALMRMSALAEKNLCESLRALVERDLRLAQQVDEADNELDRIQMEIDERCIELIALRQPIAKDLRFVIMTMKIASELERIGDQCVNISHRIENLLKEPALKPLVDIPRMGKLTQSMIGDVLNAFVYARPNLAIEVIERDEEVDKINGQLHRELISYMIENPQAITRSLSLMSISKNLERIGDHATNIAEEVIYLYEARDIRHQPAAIEKS